MPNNLVTIKEGNFILELTQIQCGYNVVISELGKVVYKQDFTDLEVATKTAKTTLGSLVKAARYQHLTAPFCKQNNLFFYEQII